MKQAFNKIKSVFVKKQSYQQDMVEFVHDEKNIEKAVEGSMQRRIDLINRVQAHSSKR